MKVNNRQLIRTLTLRTLKGRSRSTVAIVAIIAIALTATLFTSLFAIGGNILSSFQNETMRQIGTSAHAGLKYLSQSEYDNFKESPLIRDISYNVIIGIAENEALKKRQTEIRYSEDKSAMWGFSYPTAGRMPLEKDELACSTITLDMLGIPHRIGQKVPLEFTVRGEKHTEEFTLSGYWPGDNVAAAEQIYLSRAYMDSMLSIPENPIDTNDLGNIFGTISADIRFGNTINIGQKMDELIAERGYAPGEVQVGVNWAYVGGGETDPTTVLLVAFLLLVILASGYLIIYSVFSISVTGDIRFYGLLKTVGTTGKQLRRLVRGQALLLSAIGIPLGFLSGYLLGFALTPALLSNMTTIDTAAITISASPLIFLFSGLFSLVTVLISCSKPAKIAAKVSPMEAVRYTEAKAGRKKEKRARRVSPFSMAWANIVRRPKNFAIVILSLSLSLILLSAVYSAVRGFNMDQYLSDAVVSDFSVADHSIYSPGFADENFAGVDEATLTDISGLAGLEAQANIYFYDDLQHQLSPQGFENMTAILDGLYDNMVEDYSSDIIPLVEEVRKTGIVPLHVYGLGQMAADTIPDSVDWGKLASGDYVVVTQFHNLADVSVQSVYNVGDKVSLVNGDGELREFEVIGVVKDYPSAIDCQHGHVTDSTMFMAEDVFRDFYGGMRPMMTIFNVTDEYLPATEAWLSSYTKDSSLDYRSRGFYEAEFNALQQTILVAGGALAAILALIGLLNFVNTVLTSIMARRRELAMMQSVGMTGGQLRSMLFCEGVFYALLAVLFSVVVGLSIGSLILQGIAGTIWFFSGTFLLTPILFVAPALFVVCAVVPLVCYRHIQRESIVARLRAAE